MSGPAALRVLGLMTGTSADGVDAALIELPGFPALGAGGLPPPALSERLPGGLPRATVLEHRHTPFRDDLRARVLAAARSQADTSDLAQLHYELGAVLADAAAGLAPSADLIASHGQTVQHIPETDAGRGWHTRATLQLGEAALIAERCGLPVVSDFRGADLAAGGQGAPLVPFADRLMYAEAGVRRAVHNLGGISNLTYLPGLDAAGVLAFDTGPANALMDEVAERAGQRFDEGGRLAASGRVSEDLLEAWLRDPYLAPYLAQPPPKSSGRERWNLAHLQGADTVGLPDLAATVTAFSARTVVDAYRRFVLPLGLDEVLVAGGGAHNPMFMKVLRGGLAPLPVLTFEERGWNSGAREAAAFALLGYFAYQGWPNTLPGTTGPGTRWWRASCRGPPCRGSTYSDKFQGIQESTECPSISQRSIPFLLPFLSRTAPTWCRGPRAAGRRPVGRPFCPRRPGPFLIRLSVLVPEVITPARLVGLNPTTARIQSESIDSDTREDKTFSGSGHLGRRRDG